MLAAVQENTSLLIICNPNNPTGSYLEPAVLQSFIEQVPPDVAVVLDEAYEEFVTSPVHEDSVGWLGEHPNLVILHTFSKIYGLAGLRMGYGIADPQVVAGPGQDPPALQRRLTGADRRPHSAAACRAASRRGGVGSPKRGRVWRARLDEMGIAYHPSEANFLLVDVTKLGIPGPEVAQALLERGVLTRSGYAMDCPGWIRVTIGEVEEGDQFLSAMAEVALREGAPEPHMPSMV